MKYLYFIIIILLIIPYQSFGQISDKGVPSFNSQKKDIPLVILPEVNVKILEKEDRQRNNFV